MLDFPIPIRPGKPIYEQIVYAVKKALARGLLQSGDKFPSVRMLSRELKINPNTAQRAVADLTAQGILEVHPGRGCFIAPQQEQPDQAQSLKSLEPLAEKLIIEAVGLGVEKKRFFQMLDERWHQLKED